MCIFCFIITSVAYVIDSQVWTFKKISFDFVEFLLHFEETSKDYSKFNIYCTWGQKKLEHHLHKILFTEHFPKISKVHLGFCKLLVLILLKFSMTILFSNFCIQGSNCYKTTLMHAPLITEAAFQWYEECGGGGTMVWEISTSDKQTTFCNGWWMFACPLRLRR